VLLQVVVVYLASAADLLPSQEEWPGAWAQQESWKKDREAYDKVGAGAAGGCRGLQGAVGMVLCQAAAAGRRPQRVSILDPSATPPLQAGAAKEAPGKDVGAKDVAERAAGKVTEPAIEDQKQEAGVKQEAGQDAGQPPPPMVPAANGDAAAAGGQRFC
jgi:hypothetical protein